MLRQKKYQLLVTFTAALVGTVNTWAADSTNIDPYETFNRHSYAMNDTVDKVVYKPVATIYKTALPNIAQRGIRNAFNNIDTVPIVANDILQLKIYQGTQDLWRLFFNTTFGVLGLFDVADKIGLPAHQNDFGMTLANWGFRNSNYFVIPFLGPSTVRDTIGFGVDVFYLSLYPYISNVRLRNSLVGLNFIQTRAQLLQYENFMAQAAVDPYVFQRNAYLQRRKYLLRENLGEPAGNEDDTYVSSEDNLSPKTSAKHDDNDPYVA